MARIFILGATGYIGGSVLTALIKKYPTHTYAVLVRGSEKADKVKEFYKGHDIQIVLATLDDFGIIESEAEKADIVINCADNDHEPSTNAIVSGLHKRSPSLPNYLIHTSGTSILDDHEKYGYGSTITKHIYDDLDGVSAVTSLPDHAWHRNVDKLVLAAGAAPTQIKTAIICPCCIYGIGTGAVNTVSIQIPGLIKTIAARGKGFTVNKGQSIWNNIHISDLAQLYVLLVEKALQADESPDVWGEKGYYFAENGQHVWKDLTAEIVKILHKRGVIKSTELDELTPEEVAQITGNANAPKVWGSNSRGKANRARRVLGWEPVGEDVVKTLDNECSVALAW